MWESVLSYAHLGLGVSLIAIAVIAYKENGWTEWWLAGFGMSLVIYLAGGMNRLPKSDVISHSGLIGLLVSALAIIVIGIRKSSTARKWLITFIVCLVLSIAGLPNSESLSDTLIYDGGPHYTPISEIVGNEANVGQPVETLLRVTKFNYDSTTKIKYLELSDDDDYIDGVIFPTSKVPYINVKKCYLVRGTLQDNYSLNITYMEPMD